MPKTPIDQIVQTYFSDPSSFEITIHTMNSKGEIPITITKNLPPGTSENEFVRKESFCQILSIYRNGKKEGMKTIKKLFIKFDKVNVGNHIDVPMKGQSMAISANDDSTV